MTADFMEVGDPRLARKISYRDDGFVESLDLVSADSPSNISLSATHHP
jgi:hypothetical protein